MTGFQRDSGEKTIVSVRVRQRSHNQSRKQKTQNMKKTVGLLIAIMLTVPMFGQKLQRNNGYAYKIRKEGNKYEEIERVKVTDQNIDILSNKDTSGYGRRYWVMQDGDGVMWREVNRVPMTVSAGGTQHNKKADLTIVVIDKNGVAIKDAKVSIVNKKVKKGKQPDTVAVMKYNPEIMGYEKKGNYFYEYTQPKKKVPYDYYYMPVRSSNLYVTVEAEIDGARYKEDYMVSSYGRNYYEPGNQTSWFMVDKNRYRPEDKLRWKVVAINQKGKPYQGMLEGRINGKKVTEPTALNGNGSAWGEITLKEVENLKAGRYYSIEWYVAAKDTECIGTSQFRYEDYELKSLKVKAKTDNEVEWGKPIHFAIEATDEKGDPMMNGEVKYDLTSGYVNKIFEDVVVLPNALAKGSMTIANGKAEVEIPTADFVKAEYIIYLQWTMRTPDGEERRGNSNISYKRELKQNQPDIFEPYKPAFSVQKTTNESDSVGFEIKSEKGEFNWQLFKNGKKIKEGTDTALDWKTKETANAIYDIYYWSTTTGEQSSLRAIHSAEMIDLIVTQPDKVEPGDEVEITVKALDTKGKPIEGMDITALAYTTKLGYNASGPSDWNTKCKYLQDPWMRAETKGYYTQRIDSIEPGIKEILGADTVEYYRLLNAKDDILTLLKPCDYEAESVAPILVKDGKIVSLALLRANYKNIYVAGTDDRYAFKMTKGNYLLEFYTRDTVYRITLAIEPVKAHKRWYAIPADACEKAPLNNAERINNIRRPQSSLCNYVMIQEKGLPKYKVGRQYYTSGIHQRMNGVCQETRTCNLGFTDTNTVKVFPGNSNLVDVWAKERIISCFTNSDNAKIPEYGKNDTIDVCQVTVSADDSLLTYSELIKNYNNQLKQIRRNITFNYSDVNYYSRDSSIALRLINQGKEPLNIAYMATADSVYSIFSNLWSAPYLKLNTEYEFVMLYDNYVMRKVKFTTPKDKNCNLYLMVSADSTKLQLYDDYAIMLESLIMKLAEERTAGVEYEHYQGKIGEMFTYNYGVIKGGKHKKAHIIKAKAPKPAPVKRAMGRAISVNAVEDAMMYEEEAMELDEVVAVAYGSVSKKSIVGSNARSVTNDAIPEAAVEEEFDEVIQEEIEMRKNFSDVAFWKPDLVTDQNGEARFTVKYPDDLTEWEVLIAGIKGKKRGYDKQRVIARKDIVGQLKMPRFAIEGDSVGAIGIGVDYINNVSEVDTFYQTATGDSICMTYTYKNDGERRCSPIYKKGLEMIDGQYILMDNDTAFTLNYNPEWGEMKVGVYTDTREIFMNDIKNIANADWCSSNDYLALRLEAMRMQPQTDSIKKAMDKIEERLNENRGEDGMWGWYGKAPYGGSLWTTEQVCRVLKVEKSYTLSAKLAELFADFEASKNWSSMLQVLKVYEATGDTLQLNVRIGFVPEDSLSITDRIDLQMMKGETVAFDTMRHTTYTDGEFYAFENKALPRNCCWYDPVYGQVELTLRAYRYYENRGETSRCKAIKRWLMQYIRGRWMSERMKLDIVKTIWGEKGIQMSDVLYQLSVDGKVVMNFPYTINASRQVKVEYEGKRDIYIGTEQNHWAEDPEPQSNGMIVDMTYEKGLMTVTVDFENDAEYVMLSCPIPAGCFYEDDFTWRAGESGREQYRDRVNIYFDRVSAGKHEIKIKLNERYPGRYTVNPAQAKLIYFPVFNGNGKMQVVEL